jgi:hypothetical protein
MKERYVLQMKICLFSLKMKTFPKENKDPMLNLSYNAFSFPMKCNYLSLFRKKVRRNFGLGIIFFYKHNLSY